MTVFAPDVGDHTSSALPITCPALVALSAFPGSLAEVVR